MSPAKRENGARSLESLLWDAANILRGPVDASDFKAYVFPLLFLKRISDVFDEEQAAALEESGGDREYAQGGAAGRAGPVFESLDKVFEQLVPAHQEWRADPEARVERVPHQAQRTSRL